MSETGTTTSRKPGRNIGLWLDNYDDLFSDFDPRSYEERNLSDDFLAEMNKLERENKQGISQVELLMPQAIRDTAAEAIIVRRIHAHFRKKHRETKSEVQKLRTRGIVMTIGGMLLLAGAGYVASLETKGIAYYVLLAIFEPGGWFLAWTGLDTFYYSLRRKKPQLDYFERMMHCQVVFRSIEN